MHREVLESLYGRPVEFPLLVIFKKLVFQRKGSIDVLEGKRIVTETMGLILSERYSKVPITPGPPHKVAPQGTPIVKLLHLLGQITNAVVFTLITHISRHFLHFPLFKIEAISI